VFCPILKFREEKQTFAKIERDNIDFFQKEKAHNDLINFRTCSMLSVHREAVAPDAAAPAPTLTTACVLGRSFGVTGVHPYTQIRAPIASAAASNSMGVLHLSLLKLMEVTDSSFLH
jgi:hypothetical protein